MSATCQFCGSKFSVDSPYSRFCSKECGVRYDLAKRQGQISVDPENPWEFITDAMVDRFDADHCHMSSFHMM